MLALNSKKVFEKTAEALKVTKTPIKD